MSTSVTKIATTIADPMVAFVSFEGADQAIAILNDWMKWEGDIHVLGNVTRVRDALQNLCGADADIIMMEDS